MLASLTGPLADMIKARLRAMTVTAALALCGVGLLLTALGFGVALLYSWLELELGTFPALAIIAGACVLLALILFAVAAWRPKPGDRRAHHGPPPPRLASATGSAAAADRMMDEALTAVRHGSREQMLAALSLAVVTGIMLGRRV
jgi:hypothetical protein